MSRIEITYSPLNKKAEDLLFHSKFPDYAKIDLDAAFGALDSVISLGRHLSMLELLEGFIKGAKGTQLLIV